MDRVGEGGSEDEEHPSQYDESHHGSEQYPGQSEDEAFGDNAQWADEYRHILAHEREHGLLVSPRSSPIRASEPLHPGEITAESRTHLNSLKISLHKQTECEVSFV